MENVPARHAEQAVAPVVPTTGAAVPAAHLVQVSASAASAVPATDVVPAAQKAHTNVVVSAIETG